MKTHLSTSAGGNGSQADSSGSFFETNFIKKARNSIFFLLTYIDTVDVNYYPIHVFVSIWRIVQFTCPSLAVGYPHFWDPNNPISRAMSIISIFFHLIPPESRGASSIIVEFIYIGILFITFMIILFSSLIFRRNAKAGGWVPSFVVIFANGILLLIQPIVYQISGETLGRLIAQTNYYDFAIEVVALSVTVIVIFLYFLFTIKISSVTFIFRPYSLMTILYKPQLFFMGFTAAVTFITALASQLTSLYPRAALTFLSAVLYFFCPIIIYMPGSFINSVHKKLLFSASYTSALFMILVALYDILGHSAVMIELFVFIFVFILFYISSNFVRRWIVIRKLRYLDEKGDDINNYKNISHFLDLAIVAFEHSHHTLSDWLLFKNGASRFEDQIDFWLTFGKFVSIYPDENNLLSYIIHSMQNRNFRGFIARQAIYQAQTILIQREGSLSPDLKMRLNKTARQVQFAKRKLRHVWDLAIQSNTVEMDSSINNAFVSVNKARSNFHHLFTQYPNNRFVARAFVRYVFEVEGDQQLYGEWCEKIRNLQRGILVHPDRTNLLGMHAYPILPIISQSGMAKPAGNMQSDSTEQIIPSEGGNELLDDNNGSAQMNEQISVIQDRIRVLSVPAVKCIVIWMSILYFLLILVPAVGMIIYAPIFLNDLTMPLDYMFILSFIRNAAFMLPVFGHHYVCENVPSPAGVPSPLQNHIQIHNQILNQKLGKDEINLNDNKKLYVKVNERVREDDEDLEGHSLLLKPIYDDFYLSSFGGENSTKSQIKYIMTTNANSVEEVADFRSWSVNNMEIDIVHKIVFENFIPFTYYTSEENSFPMNVSLITAMMEVSLQISQLLSQEPSDALLNSTYLVNPIVNAMTIVEYTSKALQTLNEYLSTKNKDIGNIILFCIMFLCIVYTVTIAGLLIFQIENLKNAKNEVFQCLTALPKNVVSNIAESMKLISKDNEMTEDEDDNLNKQEENILKVFSSASDISVTRSTERLMYIFLNVCLAICVIVIIVLVCEVFPTISKELQMNAPHLDYVLGSITYLFGAIGYLDYLVVDIQGYSTPLMDKFFLMEESLESASRFNMLYEMTQYGGEALDAPPFKGFTKSYNLAEPYFTCENVTKVPEDFSETYKCFSIDVQMDLFQPFIQSLIRPFNYSDDYTIVFNSPVLYNMWITSVKLFDKLFYPMYEEIVVDMKDLLSSAIPRLRNPAIFVLFICFIIILLIYYEAHKSSQRIKFALSLLLQCPPSVVMQTAKVMDILSGDFGSKSHDGTLRHREFFDAIVRRIPDSVIVCDDEFIVESVNRSSERIYGIRNDDFVGRNARDFFFSNKFSENTRNLFSEDESQVEQAEYKENENDNSYLSLSLMKFRSHYVITARDITPIISYKQLIHDEKAKSDKLLTSILPPDLIPRVQNGEQNISFSVQSATILFLDIVEFTPWCAANTAQMIMSTLNLMFRELDSRLQRHSTITKIKCIGDCYMAAGGIFVEVNQPAVHAKEVVEFGLEAIQALLFINEKHSLKLKIRVGVNTGGPIVAGVFGTDKPTFEILGPAINMAQQMEHHGVPMLVHISRSTYELIYGGSFAVKERGHIEIKNGTVSTYLVSGKGV